MMIQPQTWEVALAELKAADHTAQLDPSIESPSKAKPWVCVPIFDAIFHIHDRAVATQELRYAAVASVLWQELLGLPIEREGHYSFQYDVVLALRQMNMKACVIPGMAEMLPKFFEKYASQYRTFLLWTTGDIESYIQIAKVHRTGLFDAFVDAKSTIATDKQPLWFGCSKKLEALEKYIDKHLATTDKPLKLVVIEDSRGTLRKIKKFVSAKDPKVSFIPIFAGYSAEGLKAQEAAREDTQVADELREFNTIYSPDELLDTTRFGEIFVDATVLCDFDGVLVENGKDYKSGTRRERGIAITRALITAVMRTQNLSERAARVYVRQRAKALLQPVKVAI